MERCAVLTPGRQAVHQSSLGFAQEAVWVRDARIHWIWWSPPPDRSPAELAPWVCDQVSSTLDSLPDFERPLLVGKSLGTLAAPVAAARGLPAIWLTPLLHEEAFIETYVEHAAPRLLVGGTGDPMWDGAAARRLSPYVCEIEGADHGMFVPGPLAASGRVHGEFGAAIEAFIDGVVWPEAPPARQ